MALNWHLANGFPLFAVVLIQFSFVDSKVDLSLFVHIGTSNIIYILIYVDEIIIIGYNAAIITYIIH